MNNFEFYTPTEIIFGKNVEEGIGKKVRELGKKNVLLIYGGGSAVKSGLIERVEKSLTASEISVISKGGVQPNPRLSFVREAIQEALEKEIDFVIAVGGGSVIDTAKAVSLGVANPDEDVWKFFTREKTAVTGLGVGVVLTISAAGSETSDSCVITNEDGPVKRGLNSPLNRPVFAFMNPELTYSLSKYQISCGIVDIMMHTMDRYFAPDCENELTDQIAEGLLRVVMNQGIIAMRDSHDYHAMSELMWCGSISHNGLTGLGQAKDFAVHQLGHELSATFDSAHGATLSAVWGSWALYVYQTNVSRFARYARNVWNVAATNDEEAARIGIQRTVDYFKSIDMPVTLTELHKADWTESLVAELADRCAYGGTRTIGQFKVLARDDIREIYRAAVGDAT